MWCLSLSLSSWFFETGSLLNLELANSAGLAGPVSPRIRCYAWLLQGAEVQSQPSHLYSYFPDSNISSHWPVPVIHFLLFLCEKSSGHSPQLFVTRKPPHSALNILVVEDSLTEGPTMALGPGSDRRDEGTHFHFCIPWELLGACWSLGTTQMTGQTKDRTATHLHSTELAW